MSIKTHDIRHNYHNQIKENFNNISNYYLEQYHLKNIKTTTMNPETDLSTTTSWSLNQMESIDYRPTTTAATIIINNDDDDHHSIQNYYTAIMERWSKNIPPIRHLHLESNRLELSLMNTSSYYNIEPYNSMINLSFNNTTTLDDDSIEISNSTNNTTTSIGSILTLNILLTLILPYSVIFLLSIVGNLLVIITLTLDRSMRSVTNIFLLNLAISDLLLGVFCMPFTLVGVLLRRFIFGSLMCHLIPYFQSVSVAVSVWTLVAMSIERYYAICHPFRSRESRQTKKHAYRILAFIWTMAFILMSPTAIVSRLKLLNNNSDHYKCREDWEYFLYKQIFTLFLNSVLLIIPLIIMILTYSSIALTLRNSVKNNSNVINSKCLTQPPSTSSSSSIKRFSTQELTNNKTKLFLYKENCLNESKSSQSLSQPKLLDSNNHNHNHNHNNNNNNIDHNNDINSNSNHHHNHSDNCSIHSENSIQICTNRNNNNLEIVTNYININNNNNTNNSNKRIKNNGSFDCGHQSNKTILRVSTNHPSANNRQRRIITMLFVVVMEFFICWTPIFVLDTVALYDPALVYGSSATLSKWISIDIISICHLLCFCSSCTNPITYCFMNQRFRDHFMSLFRCRRIKHGPNMNTNLNSAATTS